MATSSTSGTSTYSYLLSSSNRVGGLASGLDTAEIVSKLMKAERVPLDKLNQKKTKLQWKQAAELEVNNLLKDFRDKYLSILSKDSYMLSSNNIKTNKVTMGSTSVAVSISANSDAVAGVHTLDYITSIASGANASSASSVSSAPLSTSASLADLALSTPLAFEDGALSFSINGKTFTFQSTDSLQQVMNTINSDKDANATLSYSQLTGKFSLVSKTQGSTSGLELSNISGNFFGSADPDSGDIIASAIGIDAGTYQNGTNAVLSIDGTTVTRDSNNITIDGMIFNLTGISSTPVTYSVAQNVDTAVTKITEFVNAYNALIENLNGRINEKKYQDYSPLTDAQKSDMSEEQIKQWDEKAKSGLLRNDSNVSSMLQSIRSAFFSTVESAGISASSIGLSTGSYKDNGKILIDETKLRKALTDNPDQVVSLFTTTSSSTDAATKFKQSGLAARIQTAFNNYLSDYNTNRALIESDELDDLDDDITAWTAKLKDREERYWKKFDALETAMQKFNAQSTWLTQQFSSGS